METTYVARGNRNSNSFDAFDLFSYMATEQREMLTKSYKPTKTSNSKEEKIFMPKDFIERVVFNNPATIVFWKDGTKTVVKCQDCDDYSKEHGLCVAICKKVFGNKGNFNDVLNKWLDEDKES